MLLFASAHALWSRLLATSACACDAYVAQACVATSACPCAVQTSDYDFNIHIMDFQPGEYLFVKVRGQSHCRQLN